MKSLREVEKYVLQVALAQGLIDQQMLAQAGKFRQKQTEAGRTTTLLRVLRPFVSPQKYAQIEQLWNRALAFANEQARDITASGIDAGLHAPESAQLAKRKNPGPRRMRDSTIDRLID